MSAYIDVEGMERASIRMERAAESANRAADRLEEVLQRLNVLTGEGYGNNVERLILLLETAQNTPHTS